MVGGVPQSNPTERASREEILALFKDRREAFDTLDAVALAKQYTEDCTVESPVGGVHQGRANVEKVYRAWFDAFLDMEIETELLLIDGQHVAEVIRVEGTNIGDFMRLPASGKRFQFTGVCLFDLRGCQIARERRIYDFTGLLVQVGVLKAKPG
ncbi:MAG: hypothetical protein EHM89_19725 [Acidobacteria bacterium]|nr:MAG: hypothetical protein EHM89_19725 [Acidobacteriota bacterium]